MNCLKCGHDLRGGGTRIGGERIPVHAKKCPTDKKPDVKKAKFRWNGTFRGKLKNPEIIPYYKYKRGGLTLTV